jgi:hypothetical protein
MTQPAQVIALDDYKLILGCLHPDRQPEVQERYGKAFGIWKRLERRVIG